MSNDTEKHRQLIRDLRTALATHDGSFEQKVIQAFEHVFEHLDRLNSHVSAGGPEGDERPLKPNESPTLR